MIILPSAGGTSAASYGRSAVADAPYTVLTTDYLVAYTSISAARNVTLPAASTFAAGRRLVVIDESGSVSATNTISVVPNGADTIAGQNATQVAINVPRGRIELESNGSNGWAVIGPWSVFLTNTLGGDQACNNISNYFDGPSVAVPAYGVWQVVDAYATVIDTGGNANFFGKLWDGTNSPVASTALTAVANQYATLALGGIVIAPAGNIRLSIRDSSNTTGVIKFNVSGNSKDSSITVQRIG